MEQLKRLAEFVADFHLSDAPETVTDAAEGCILDTVSAAIGARENKMFQNIKQVYLSQEGQGLISATIWGSGEKAPVHTAAFLNAMAGHTLEMDDVHTNSKTHIGTVVVPAAWAAAESMGSTGKQLLEAVICGYEVMSRIGMGFGVSGHRNMGWHVTGTAGTFGAAAACAKIYGFNSEQITSAFGLAGMQSCTTWAFLEGSSTDKVMHPARAAASGIESCMLVQGGMTGPSHILDAKDGGIFPMMSNTYNYDLICQGLGTEWEILKVDKKPYPCCRSTHGSIDAGITLKEKYHIDPSDIDHVDIETYLVGLKQCGMSGGSIKPSLATEAKFSTPYVAAVALIAGQIGLDDFSMEKISDANRQDLLSRIYVHEDEEFTREYPNHWGCRMNVVMRDGTIYTQLIRDASGSVSSPLTKAQLRRKAISCCKKFSGDGLNNLFYHIENLHAEEKLPCTVIY